VSFPQDVDLRIGRWDTLSVFEPDSSLEIWLKNSSSSDYDADVRAAQFRSDGSVLIENGLQLPTSGVMDTCVAGKKNRIDGNATGVYGCNGTTWVRLF
jgi:hypothetical protein